MKSGNDKDDNEEDNQWSKYAVVHQSQLQYPLDGLKLLLFLRLLLKD